MSRPTSWRLAAANAPMGLRAASDEMDEILSSFGVSEGVKRAARLVSEELVLNAFEHGGASFVSIAMDPAGDPHVLIFEDDGVSFDPATRSIQPLPHTPEEVRARGRGLALVHGSTRRIDHRREHGHNRLAVLLVE